MRVLLYLTLCSAAGLSLVSCKSFSGATAKVSPNPLEVHADSVQFKATATVAPKSGIKKGGKYNAELVIKNGGNSYPTASAGIDTDALSKDEFKTLIKEGKTVGTSAKVAYQEGMDGGILTAVNTYTRKGKTFELEPIELAPCCITTSRLVCQQDQFILSKFKWEKQTQQTLPAKFEFPQNIWKIQPNQYNKQDITEIVTFLNKKYNATKISLHGFASPEGKYKRNKFLALKRLQEVQAWLVEQMKKEGYTSYLDSSFFSLQTTDEDWEGFKANLDNTNYPEDVKRQIIDIISSGLELDVIEKRVMALVGGATEVEFILAPLRRVTITVEGASTGHSDEEVDMWAREYVAGRKSGADLKAFYTVEEFFYAISRLQNTDEKKKLAAEVTRQHPEDWRGWNDLGVYQSQTGEADAAAKSFEKAAGLAKGSAAVNNNWGVVLKNNKKYDDALAKLRTSNSAAASPEAAFNLGVVLQKKAQYNEAADMFRAAGSVPCSKYNSGLCKLLVDELASAKVDLENSIRENKNYALSYYLMAILGARSADTNLMTLNLKRAVQLDNSLSEKAKADLEFRRYFNNAEFNEAVKP